MISKVSLTKENEKEKEEYTTMYLREQETSTQIPTMEAVMEELQEVTRQYVSCTDPVKAAARRQRVLTGDARREMEKAAMLSSSQQKRSY